VVGNTRNRPRSVTWGQDTGGLACGGSPAIPSSQRMSAGGVQGLQGGGLSNRRRAGWWPPGVEGNGGGGLAVDGRRVAGEAGRSRASFLCAFRPYLYKSGKKKRQPYQILLEKLAQPLQSKPSTVQPFSGKGWVADTSPLGITLLDWDGCFY
jgi:hypothetical protein